MTDHEIYPVYSAALEELGMPPMPEAEFVKIMALVSPTAHALYHWNLMKLVGPAQITHEVDDFLATINVSHPEPQ